MEKNTRKKSTHSISSNVTRKDDGQKKSTRPIRPYKPSRKNKDVKKDKRNKKKHPVLKKVLIISALLIVLLILVAVGVFCGIFFSDKFALSTEDLLLSKANTVVYDKDGNVVMELSGDENRKIIAKDEMTPNLPNAFIAIEDERFGKHHGVDWKRTIAATFQYILKGNSSFGGSTIPQQLVKNITNEKESSGKAGIDRKIREMSRAMQISKMLTPDQILELYLNIIPLGADGGDICGVEMASLYYFNKSAKDLTIEECAFLAGINHSPNVYNPFRSEAGSDENTKVMNKIKDRTKTVLKKMKDLNHISQDQYDSAVAATDEGLKFNKGNLPSGKVESYFVQAALDQVVNDMVEQKNVTKEYAKSRVFGGGYKIYLTQSTPIQTAMEEVYKSDKYVLNSSEHGNTQHAQSAMIIIDHKTGQVVGCMGGLGTDVNAIGLNRATSSKRQPGSSFKPVVTYGCAIQKNIITPATVYYNAKTTFGKDWSPDSSGYYSGPCTVRQGIEISSNTIAAKIMAEIGPDNAIDYARECGITSLVKSSEDRVHNDSNISSMALGGLTHGVYPLELAGAYAMMANGGVYKTPIFYTEVKDASGETILKPKQETKRIMSEQQAYLMKSLLKQPVEGAHGTATGCKIAGVDVGAKTGTTQENTDRWLSGMTPYYTATTWYGYDDSKVKINGSGNYAAKIWIDVMERVHKNKDNLDSSVSPTFTEPSGIVKLTVCRKSGLKASSSCTDTYQEVFAEGSLPDSCEGHSLKICTDSKKLASEFCPNTEYVAYVPPHERNAKWKTEGYSSTSNVPSDKCDLHATPGTTKTVTVSDGVSITVTDIKVPSVVGKTKEAAKKEIEASGLEASFRDEIVTTGKEGVVLKQSVSPGTQMAKGGKVTLTVSKLNNGGATPSTSPSKTNTPSKAPSNNPVITIQ